MDVSKQHKKAFIILLVMFLVIALTFGSSILYWYIAIDAPFRKYEQAVGDYTQTFPIVETFKGTCIDGKIYKVIKPKFMKYNGILSVYDEITPSSFSGDTSQIDMRLTLTINVSPMGKLNYSIETISDLGVDLTIRIDEHGNILEDSVNEANEQILKKNHDEIEKMLTIAKELWELE